MEQHYLFNNITAIIFSILILGMFGIYCMLLVRKYKRPIGELLTWQAIKHNESVFIFMLIAACVAEGLSAATVLAPGLIPANPLARVVGHMFISFAGIFGAMTLFKDAAQILFPGSDGLSKFFQFLVVLFLVVLTIGSPMLNLYLMAGNLKQDLELRLYFFQIAPWTTESQWRQVADYYELDYKWSAWAALEPNLKVSIGITMLHFIIAGLEGARAMSTKKRRDELFKPIEDSFKDEPKKEDGKKDEGKKDESKDESGDVAMKKNLVRLLTFYGGYDDSAIKTFSDQAYTQLLAIADTTLQTKFGVRIAQLAQDIIALEKESLTQDQRSQKGKEIKLKIRELFGGKKDSTDPKTKGFGITLHGVK